MPSKTQKKITCQHVFTLGDRKGKKCGKGCRDGYCKNHKKAKKEYKTKWFQEQQQKKKALLNDDAVNKIYDCKDINKLPSISKLEKRKWLYRNSYLYNMKKLIGYNIKNEINQDQRIEILKIFEKGKCKCVDSYEPTQEEIDKYKDEYLISEIPDFDTKTIKTKFNKVNKNKPNEEIIDEILRNKRCSKCEKYNPAFDCKYCHSKYIEYYPIDKKVNELQIKKLEKKINRILEKNRLNIKIINAVKEMTKKLENN